MKIVVANHVPYADESAISLVEYALEEFAKEQGATSKDVTEETPHLVEVKIAVSRPTTAAPDASERSTSFIELKCHKCGAIIDAALTQMPRG